MRQLHDNQAQQTRMWRPKPCPRFGADGPLPWEEGCFPITRSSSSRSPHMHLRVQLFLIKISYPDKTTPKNWAALLSGSQGMQVPGGRLGLQEDAGGLCCSAEGRILQEPEEVWFQQGHMRTARTGPILPLLTSWDSWTEDTPASSLWFHSQVRTAVAAVVRMTTSTASTVG